MFFFTPPFHSPVYIYCVNKIRNELNTPTLFGLVCEILLPVGC